MGKVVQKFGDWEKVGKLFNGLADRFNGNMKLATILVAELIDSTVTEHLDSQYDLNWPDLSEKYLQWKIDHGYSTDKYTMTSTYRQNIATHISADGMSGFVGVSRQTETGVELPYVLEYGSDIVKIPERPLWRPTFQESKPQVIEIYKRAMTKTLQIG